MIKTVREWFGHNNASNLWETDKAFKHLDDEVIKEFSISSTHGLPWLSWQEFGKEKHVMHWCITKRGYAIGWNENPSRGYSYPVVKLKAEQIEKYVNHNLTYEEYYK